MRLNNTSQEDSNSVLSFQPFSNPGDNNIELGSIIRQDIDVYIHIPFCEKRCFFCSIDTDLHFTSLDMEAYIQALKREIEYYQDLFRLCHIQCIHFGGGTPSLLSEHQILEVVMAFSRFKSDLNDIEIVFESNPLSLTPEKLNLLSSLGNVSLNIGIQTFDNHVLKAINRGYNFKQVYDLIDSLAGKSFNSLGIDLICNLPMSNLDTTIRDIDITKELGINHVSLYPLRIEPNSVFYDNYIKYQDNFLSRADQRHTLEETQKYLVACGYEQYMLYHFINQKKRAYQYSVNQVSGGEWIGLGAGAYSYYRNHVIANVDNIGEYIQNCSERGSCSKLVEKLDGTGQLVREFLYSLRGKKLEKLYYRNKYGSKKYEILLELFEVLIRDGYATDMGSYFQLTIEGIFGLADIEKKLVNSK